MYSIEGASRTWTLVHIVGFGINRFWTEASQLIKIIHFLQIDSALSMTPFSDLFLGAKVNNIYTSRNSNIGSPVFVNMTVQLAESQETLRAPVKQDLQKHLMGVIQRRSNNIGSSALWVDNPTGVVSQIHGTD